MPQMLHGKVFRATQACARIVRLDVSRARALPGVACVITAADVPNARLMSDMPGQTGQKQRAGSDVPVLASDQVRFYGEPLALVAAETVEIAEQALKLIEVEYETNSGRLSTRRSHAARRAGGQPARWPIPACAISWPAGKFARADSRRLRLRRT